MKGEDDPIDQAIKNEDIEIQLDKNTKPVNLHIDKDLQLSNHIKSESLRSHEYTDEENKHSIVVVYSEHNYKQRRPHRLSPLNSFNLKLPRDKTLTNLEGNANYAMQPFEHNSDDNKVIYKSTQDRKKRSRAQEYMSSGLPTLFQISSHTSRASGYNSARQAQSHRTKL